MGWALAAAAVLAGLVLLALLLFVAAPVGLLKPMAEDALSARLGRRITIGTMVREDRLSFSPTIRLEDVTVPQPSWVTGDRTPMARIRSVSARLPLLPILVGRIKPDTITIAGLDLRLVREASGRANWQGGKRAGKSTGYARLAIRDSHVRLNDAYKQRTADLALTATPETGFRATGDVSLRGSKGRLTAFAAVDGRFTAQLDSAALTARAEGRMGPAYESARLTAQVQARGRDLRDLDAVIEAGLPGTQAFDLTATVAHDRPDWTVTNLRGTIGRSRIAADLTVKKRDDRVRLDGAIHAAQLDFDDLASDEQLGRGAALARVTGPRLIQPTRIMLDKVRHLDGRVTIRVDRLLWRTPSLFRSGSATATIDHGTLTLSDLVARLPHGTLTGRAVVAHASGEPRLTLDLSLQGARTAEVFGSDAVTAPLAGRAHLSGTGRTMRAALAGGQGSVALVAAAGSMNAQAAELLGRNVTRALRTDAGERVAMRCLVARFEGRGGRFTPAPLVLDTSVMRADGRGVLDLSTERLQLTLDGRSKVPAAFRLSGPIVVGGTIKRPIPAASAAATSTGGILKSISRALSGKTEPAAPDADCTGLSRAALR